MKRISVIGLILIVLLSVGCGAQESRFSAVSDELEAPAEAPAAEPGTNGAGDMAQTSGVEVTERLIIRNGELSLTVKDTMATQEEIERLADELGGYILSSERHSRGTTGQYNIHITLRVPAETFNNAMSSLRDMAIEVVHDSTSSQDVTEEYVDLESRLRALEVKAARLEELMDEADDTEAVLEIYRELSTTQQQIEETKGRMRYLEKSAAMATINVALNPDVAAGPVEVSRWRPGGTIKSAVEALVNTLKFLVDALIWILIYIAPVLLVIGLVIFGVVKLLLLVFKPKAKGRKQAKEPAPPEAAEAPEA